MKIKTAELKDAALDWAVAKCEGVKNPIYKFAEPEKRVYPESTTNLNTYRDIGHFYICGPTKQGSYSPSTIWAQGGPIIERENINWEFIGRPNCIVYQARLWEFNFQYDYYMHDYKQIGSTPLIAAMRCYVASKLGDEVEIP